MTDVAQPAAAPANAAPQPAGTTAATQEAPKPERTFSQAELDEIIEKKSAKWLRQKEELKTEAAALRRLVLGNPQPKEPEAPKPKEAQAGDTAKPKREDFQDYDLFIEALADWKADEKVKAERTKRSEDEAKDRAEREARTARQTYTEREAKAREKHEDFEEVALDNSLPINDVMAQAIIDSEEGPELLYYLGHNRKEAERISKLSPLQAIKELGKLEAKLAESPADAKEPKEREPAKAAPKKESSKAPEPIQPVGGKAAPVDSQEPSDSDPVDVWLMKRRKQLERQGKFR